MKSKVYFEITLWGLFMESNISSYLISDEISIPQDKWINPITENFAQENRILGNKNTTIECI